MHSAPVQQPFSVIAYRFLVCSQLFESGVIHKVPELTVAIQEGQVHVGYVCAFSGIGRLEGFLYASTGQQATQQRAQMRPLRFNEFAGFNRIRFAVQHDFKTSTKIVAIVRCHKAL